MKNVSLRNSGGCVCINHKRSPQWIMMEVYVSTGYASGMLIDEII